MDESKLTPAGKKWLACYKTWELASRNRTFLYGKWARPTLRERLQAAFGFLFRRR